MHMKHEERNIYIYIYIVYGFILECRIPYFFIIYCKTYTYIYIYSAVALACCRVAYYLCGVESNSWCSPSRSRRR